MISYIYEGIWIAKESALLGLIVFIAYQGILLVSKKRTLKEYKDVSKLLLIAELLLAIYICTILKITGIITAEPYFGFSINGVRHQSIKMRALSRAKFRLEIGVVLCYDMSVELYPKGVDLV